MCDIVVKKFTFAISSPDEFLYIMHAQVLLCIEVSHFTNSKDMIGNKFKKWSRDPDQAHPGVVLSSLDIFYLPAKFGDFRFSRSAAMISGIKTENASCNTNHAPLRVICHLYAGT